MPTYEFKCTKCGEHNDRMIPIHMLGDAYIFNCPNCGRTAEMRRVWTPPAIHIKKGITEKLGEEMKI